MAEETDEKDVFEERDDQLNEFDEAFEEADDKPTDDPKEIKEEKEELELPDGDPGATDNPGKKEEQEEGEAEAGGPGGEEQQATEGNEPSLEERLQQAEAKMSSWDGRLRAAAKREQELLAELEALKSKQDQDTDEEGGETDEERQQALSEAEGELEEFYQDYPSFKRPIELAIDRRVDEKVKAALKPITDKEAERSKQEEEAADEAVRESEEAHVRAIAEAHSDWDKIASSGDLDKWIEEQPAALKRGYKAIIADGDTAEVIDLFTSYKKAKGLIEDKATEPDQGEEERESIRNRRSRQATDGEAVHGRSGGPPRRALKEDFDGAFEEAVESDR